MISIVSTYSRHKLENLYSFNSHWESWLRNKCHEEDSKSWSYQNTWYSKI